MLKRVAKNDIIMVMFCLWYTVAFYHIVKSYFPTHMVIIQNLEHFNATLVCASHILACTYMITKSLISDGRSCSSHMLFSEYHAMHYTV